MPWLPLQLQLCHSIAYLKEGKGPGAQLWGLAGGVAPCECHVRAARRCVAATPQLFRINPSGPHSCNLCPKHDGVSEIEHEQRRSKKLDACRAARKPLLTPPRQGFPKIQSAWIPLKLVPPTFSRALRAAVKLVFANSCGTRGGRVENTTASLRRAAPVPHVARAASAWFSGTAAAALHVIHSH